MSPLRSWRHVRSRVRKTSVHPSSRREPAERLSPSILILLLRPLLLLVVPPRRSRLTWLENSSLSCGTSPAVSRRRSSGSTRGQGRSSTGPFSSAETRARNNCHFGLLARSYRFEANSAPGAADDGPARAEDTVRSFSFIDVDRRRARERGSAMGAAVVMWKCCPRSFSGMTRRG